MSCGALKSSCFLVCTRGASGSLAKQEREVAFSVVGEVLVVAGWQRSSLPHFACLCHFVRQARVHAAHYALLPPLLFCASPPAPAAAAVPAAASPTRSHTHKQKKKATPHQRQLARCVRAHAHIRYSSTDRTGKNGSAARRQRLRLTCFCRGRGCRESFLCCTSPARAGAHQCWPVPRCSGSSCRQSRGR